MWLTQQMKKNSAMEGTYVTELVEAAVVDELRVSSTNVSVPAEDSTSCSTMVVLVVITTRVQRPFDPPLTHFQTQKITTTASVCCRRQTQRYQISNEKLIGLL